MSTLVLAGCSVTFHHKISPRGASDMGKFHAIFSSANYHVFVVVCLFVCLLATLRKTSERICTKFSGKVGNGPVNKWLNFGSHPDHCLDTGIVFRIRCYWEIRKVVSTDCAARLCSAGRALAGIAIATMTSLRHRPTTGNHDRRALAEVCSVPVLLVPTLLIFLGIGQYDYRLEADRDRETGRHRRGCSS